MQALLDALRLGRKVTYQEKLEILLGLAMMGKPASPSLVSREISDLTYAAGSTNKPLAIWAYAGLAVLTEGPMAKKYMSAISKHLKGEDLEIRARRRTPWERLDRARRTRSPLCWPCSRTRRRWPSTAPASP